jgi:hypothetical protein
VRPATAGTAVAGGCALGGAWLLIRWAYSYFSLCFSACPPAHNGFASGLLFWGATATALLGLIWSPRLARSDHRALRSALAVSAAMGAAALCLAIPFPGANAKLFLVMCAAIAVLVPPRHVAWCAGAILGCTLAGALHNTPWLGLGLGLAVLVTSVEVGARRTPTANLATRFAHHAGS